MGLFRYRTAKKRNNWKPIEDECSESDCRSFVGVEVAVEKRTVKPKRNRAPKSDKIDRWKIKTQRNGNPSDADKSNCPSSSSTNNYSSNNNSNSNQCEDESSNFSVYTTAPPVSAEGVESTNATTTPLDEFIVTTNHISYLILNLETAVVVGAKEPMRALMMLLVLAEQQHTCNNHCTKNKDNTISIHQTRVEMVRAENGKLVPVLLRFLNRCMVHSKEHKLTLVILSKLSVPQENKKIIAIDCNGVEILAKLLCEDPSCHLIALVLVNLTYDPTPSIGKATAIEVAVAGTHSTMNSIDVINYDTGDVDCGGNVDGDGFSVRKKLLDMNGDTAVVESLAFALRVSSLTQDEYKKRQTIIEDCNYSEQYLSPATRLSILMAKDQQLRSLKEEDERKEEERQRQRQISADQILEQLQSNEQELQKWGTISSRSGGRDGLSGSLANFQSRYKRCPSPPPVLEEPLHVYPETAKWCLTALRNLTKLSNDDATAAHILIKSGIYSLLVQYITIVANAETTEDSPPKASVAKTSLHYQIENNFLSASYGRVKVRKTPDSRSTTAADAVRGGDGDRIGKFELSSASNSPYLWHSNSLQNAALSIVFNLAASSKSREYVNEPHTVKVLSMIAEYPRILGNSKGCSNSMTKEQNQVIALQCLKAKMALSYLVCSQGHFGQTKLRSSASTVQANSAESSLIMSRSDVSLFVELLANTIKHRSKDGLVGSRHPLGTFDLNCVIFSLRCFLTHTTNQERIVKLVGVDLNSLLINALAQYALESSASYLDSESAEYAVFSMYLLSNYCFKGVPFLSEMFAPNPTANEDKDHGLAAKILFSYLNLSDITPAGQHAAQQLLLILKYLNFENNHILVSQKKMLNAASPVDLKIDYILLAKIKRVRIVDWKHGAKPDSSILCRPVLRCQNPRNWRQYSSSEGGKRKEIKWNDPSTVSKYANALIAVQQLSYGSIKVHRSSSESIDDIAIANDIAYSAKNESSGCYNFLWAWEDVKMNHSDDKNDDNGMIKPSTYAKRQLHHPSIREGVDVSLPHHSRSSMSGNSIASVDSAHTRSMFSDEEISLLLCCSENSSGMVVSYFFLKIKLSMLGSYCD